jgi:hypothetical protein
VNKSSEECGLVLANLKIAEDRIPRCAAAEGSPSFSQPLVELYGGCMVVLKVSWCDITS